MTHYRQGELTLTRTGDAPKGRQPTKPHELSRGSSSAHAHVLFGGKREGDKLTLYKPTELKVVGDESRHEPITLPAGTYVMSVRREYVPGEVPRRVDD